MSILPRGAIMYMIHHMFLPPLLPHEDDSNQEYDTLLVNITINALRKFRECHMEDDHDVIDTVINMVTSMKDVSNTVDEIGTVNEQKLLAALRNLPQQGTDLLSVQTSLWRLTHPRWRPPPHSCPKCRCHDQRGERFDPRRGL